MNYLINRNINMNSKNKTRQQLPLQGDAFIKNHINTNHIGTTKNMLHDLNHVNDNDLQTDKEVEQQIEALEVLNSYIEDLLKNGKLSEMNKIDAKEEQRKILNEIKILKKQKTIG